MTVVYKPTSEYSEKLFTPQTKDNLWYYLLNYADIVSGTKYTAGSQELIYTVPEGKILYLISAELQIVTSGNNHTSIFTTTGHHLIIFRANTPAYQKTSLIYPIPIRLNTGISLYTNATGLTAIYCGFVGYLIDVTVLSRTI